MKLEIIRKIEQKETIEIEFPYYYIHDLMLDEVDLVIYGKIEKDKHTKIQLTHDYRSDRDEFSVETEKRSASSLACYMTDEYKGTEADYLTAKSKLLAMAESA